MTSCMNEEMKTVCHCNIRENAQLIADILDADVEGKVYYVQQWIPCSERMPEGETLYWVTIKSKEEPDELTVTARWYFGDGNWEYDRLEPPLAWMPIEWPMPYKGGE